MNAKIEVFAVIAGEPDGKSQLVGERSNPSKVSRAFLNSTRKEDVRGFSPAAAGILTVAGLRFSADRRSYDYIYFRILSDLDVFEGLQ